MHMKRNYVDWNLNLANMLREKWMLFFHAELRIVTKFTKRNEKWNSKNKAILGKGDMIDKMRAGKWKKYLGSEHPVTNQWKSFWINFQRTLSKFKNNNVWH